MAVRGRGQPKWCRAIRPILFLLFAIGLTGCQTMEDNNFSRVENEPAPLPPETRASFGRMGIIALDGGAGYEIHSTPPPETSISPAIAKAVGAVTGEMIKQAVFNRDASDHVDSNWHRPDDHKHSNPDKPAPNQYRSPAPQGNSGHSSGSQESHQHSPSDKHWHEDKTDSSGLKDAGSELLGDVAAAGATALAAGVIHVIEKILDHAKKVERETSDKLMQRVASEQPMSPVIKARMHQLAAKQGCERLVLLDDSADAAFNTPGGTNAASQIISASGADSVLVLRMTGEELAVESVGSLRFFAEANYSALRTRDGAVLLSDSLVYSSRSRTLNAWSAHHGRRLKAERKHAEDLFGKMLLEKLFDTTSKSSLTIDTK